MPVAAFAEIARALARRRASLHARRMSYIAYQGAVSAFKTGTLVATGYAVSVVADGYHPTANELAAALDALEVKGAHLVARNRIRAES